ncbi:MAG TPA: LLM class F420-dependent oxidoreductase [Candidatus Deferrimicrobiaceae bacterium]|nr:LLM class F420-dependent oxidoreductase [Candidatus Deferrimicrobiaceae bacterium]
MYGPVGTRHGVITFARRMEALGYDSLWASDHVVIPHRIASRYPYSPTGKFPLAPEVPFLEPLTTLALVAGVTERVRLGTSILVLPHRNPVLAAKMAATLDHLSGGRLVLGVGVGWMREEIELLGGDYDRRGAWSDEALIVMRACWRDARTAHHGEFFSFDELGVFPKPAHGDIPILIGGHTPRALRRVVQLGDGWHAAFITPEALKADIARLREECARQKRPFDQVTISVRAGLSLRSAPLGSDRKPLQGSRDQVIADLAAFRDLGVESMLLETRYRDLDDMIGIYEAFARDIRPHI